LYFVPRKFLTVATKSGGNLSRVQFLKADSTCPNSETLGKPSTAERKF
jgi:hypothetical protein